MVKQWQHLIYFTQSQCRFSLFQITHKPQPHPRFLIQFGLALQFFSCHNGDFIYTLSGTLLKQKHKSIPHRYNTANRTDIKLNSTSARFVNKIQFSK